ncbi:hypothetical protein Tco_0750810 [Tanacetum coccineum]|uniref:Uncharacterized protein n=1 Tax=Tanacetum coccineum TaxID=301880 RepID=A0ABQ4Z2A8_9ASTR
MIEELFRKHMQNATLNIYPTTSTSTAGKSSIDIQHQLYLNMKSKPQDQATDLEIWEILKTNFENEYFFASHDEHHTNADPLEGGETWRKEDFGKIKANNEKESFVNERPILPMMKRL